MGNKPFIFGVATSGDNFTDRKKETERLLMNFRHGVGNKHLTFFYFNKLFLYQRPLYNAHVSRRAKLIFLKYILRSKLTMPPSIIALRKFI